MEEDANEGDNQIEFEILKTLLSNNVLSEPLSSLKSDLLKSDPAKNKHIIDKIEEIQQELNKDKANVHHIIALLDEVQIISNGSFKNTI